MKKNRISLLIVFLLILIAAIYFFSNSNGTLKLRNTSFAIDHIDKVTSIKISNGNQNVLLEKEQGIWIVDHKYKVKQHSIENFLATLNRIDLLSPVSKVEKEQIASILKSDGILVEVFKNHRILKKYFVSKPGMNKSKTYMMMFKSNEPYIVHIPSSKVNISDWFVQKESFWRDKTVFDLMPQNIKNIKVEYPENESVSFRIINYNDGTFALQDLQQNNLIKDFDAKKAAHYFTYFQGIVFEDVVENLTKEKVDSVLQSNPFIIISVEDINGITNTLKVYRKPPEQELDEFGEKAKFDYLRAYAVLNESTELILIQYYIFDPLFKEIDYFR